MSDEKKYWLDQPGSGNKLYWGLVVVCTMLGLADLLLHRHAYWSWEGFPNFYGLFGFAAFWTIVIIGKNLRRFLWRPEDYYDD